MIVGYTLGNPEVYEPSLDRGSLYKREGGAWFPTKGAAESALETSPLGHKNLPHSWFPDEPLPIPGQVYALEAEGAASGHHDSTPDEIGACLLITRARIRRC